MNEHTLDVAERLADSVHKYVTFEIEKLLRRLAELEAHVADLEDELRIMKQAVM
jgi:cell division protein FtsB